MDHSKKWVKVVNDLKQARDRQLDGQITVPTTPFSELEGAISPKMTGFIQNLSEFSSQINLVQLVTPINLHREKDRWIAALDEENFLNPHFVYDEMLLEKVAALETSLTTLERDLPKDLLNPEEANNPPKTVEQAIWRILQNRYATTLLSTQAAKAILSGNDWQTTLAWRKIYGIPSRDTMKIAAEFAARLDYSYDSHMAFAYCYPNIPVQDVGILTATPGNSRQMKIDVVNSEVIQKAFTWTADKCGIAGTRPIILDNLAAVVDVRDRSSRGAAVVIPKEYEVSRMRLLELATHEVMAHWLDSENAGILASGAMKPDDEILYEGHAMIREYNARLNYTGIAPYSAPPWPILAISAAARHGKSFADTAHLLYLAMRNARLERPLSEQVWLTTYRIFRGATDTTNACGHYGFTKDRAYFEGLELAHCLDRAKCLDLLPLGNYSVRDLQTLAPVVRFDTENLKYHARNKVLDELCAILRRKTISF